MNTSKPKTVTITFDEYRRLLDSDLFASCLEEAGVCDWEHYEDALHDGGYYDDVDEDEDDDRFEY